MSSNLRLLIVDDQPRTRQSLRALLSAGFQPVEIREAGSGYEALDDVTNFLPNLVIMDARMAGLDGIEATRMIKAGYPHIKILVLSLYPDYAIPAMDAGADAFLMKDEKSDRLLSTLTVLIKELV